ncbi:hypothetical protein SDC9_80862 [bioreactor metagenome]|uniref:Uncharacterized protein n=1 Tax=bioreactor metagenome TaxID=1076179 RepID=A0A644Z077_9ZZZZ
MGVAEGGEGAVRVIEGGVDHRVGKGAQQGEDDPLGAAALGQVVVGDGDPQAGQIGRVGPVGRVGGIALSRCRRAGSDDGVRVVFGDVVHWSPPRTVPVRQPNRAARRAGRRDSAGAGDPAGGRETAQHPVGEQVPDDARGRLRQVPVRRRAEDVDQMSGDLRLAVRLPAQVDDGAAELAEPHHGPLEQQQRPVIQLEHVHRFDTDQDIHRLHAGPDVGRLGRCHAAATRAVRSGARSSASR